MSDNSGKSSGGIVKIFKRAFKSDASSDSKNKQPSAKFSKGTLGEKRTTPFQNVAVKAVRQLDNNGFVVYNIEEQNEIFVSKPSEMSAFDDDVPLIRVSTDKFDDFEEESEPETVVNIGEPIPVEKMFMNIIPKEDLGEIDFNEVIVKQHVPEAEPAKAQLPETPVFESLSTESEEGSELIEIDTEADANEVTPASLVMIDDMVATCTEAVDINSTFIGDIQQERVLSEISIESTDDVQVEEQEIAEESDVNVLAPVDNESSDVLMDSIKLEAAVTSEVDFKPVVAELPALQITESPCMIEEIVDETPVDIIIEVKDVVADILKLTLPELNDDEMTMADLPVDVERGIPEDELESYDFKFELRQPAPVNATGSMSIDFERRKIQTIGSSLNFTF